MCGETKHGQGQRSKLITRNLDLPNKQKRRAGRGQRSKVIMKNLVLSNNRECRAMEAKQLKHQFGANQTELTVACIIVGSDGH